MAPKRIAKSHSSGKKTQKQPKNVKVSADEAKKNEKSKEVTTKENEAVGTGESKMTLCTVPAVSSRPTRRPGRPPSGKSYVALNRSRDMSAKVRSAYRRSLDPCDNSNDSGIGFDHHMDPHHHTISMSERLTWTGERAEAKRPKMDIKLESEDVNDGYCFPDTVRTCKDTISLIRTAPAGSVPSLSMNNNPSSTSGRAVPRCIPLSSRQSSSGPVPLTTQLLSSSRYMDVSLTIVKQPEQQHRARYQTEGSRGAVKDREGNGFPVVQLTGYYKPATLQVFIGTDVGKVSPHMFYQACKVSGKNSTPCLEKKVDGTCVIELQLDPAKEMSATCDCVGILKERNVDVEHRFPDQLGNRSKKKSTRCRMIFRTTITLEDGTQETLQVCSQPIVCTQPPGVPEICKKSLTSCPASGGLELFVLGKNFLKDTKVFFQQFEDGHVRWEQAVVPDKEYLQQTHFVCVVPPYRRPDITEPVSVRLCVVSSGKTSESHHFLYTPVNGAMPSVCVDPPPSQPAPFFKGNFWNSAAVSKREQDLDMMPPPESSLVPMATRRPSLSLPSTSEIHSPPLRTLKQEYIDENSQGSMVDHDRYRHISESSLDVHHGDSNISMINENSMDMIHQNSMMSHVNENSNISVGNEDSIDMMVHRNSISRPALNSEDSVDVMMRRNSVSRSTSVCENSVDCSNASMVAINGEASNSAALHPTNPSLAERASLSHQLHPSILSSGANSAAVEKVMDLRMKMPMATVSDLVNTTAPSMATLQRFGFEHSNSPLPAQSAQSVENYLTKIESKSPLVSITNTSGMMMKNEMNKKLTHMINTDQNVYQSQKVLSSQVMSGQTCGMLTSTTQSLSHLGVSAAIAGPEPVYLSSARPFLSSTTQNEALDIVTKSEAADIGEQTIPEPTSTITSTAITTPLERSVPTPINTERLDALVNSTVESHLSPTRTETAPKDMIISNVMPLTTTNSNPPEVMITSQDVMLNSQSSLMVPPIINTRLPSPILGQQELSNAHASPNLSPEVILNSQISPSMMCRSANNLQQETLLPTTNLTICQTNSSVEPTLLPQTMSPGQQSLSAPQASPESINTLHSPLSVSLAAEPEKAVLLKAAVDFLETQKKISELGTTLPSTATKCDIISMAPTSPQVMPNNTLGQLQGTGNNFVQSQFSTTCTTMGSPLMPKTPDQKSDFVIPIPVKEIATTQNDKKNEDRMIPQSFTSLTENELINLINPSCFDQGNNYQ